MERGPAVLRIADDVGHLLVIGVISPVKETPEVRLAPCKHQVVQEPEQQPVESVVGRAEHRRVGKQCLPVDLWEGIASPLRDGELPENHDQGAG